MPGSRHGVPSRVTVAAYEAERRLATVAKVEVFMLVVYEG
jgi:hypothetical protein